MQVLKIKSIDADPQLKFKILSNNTNKKKKSGTNRQAQNKTLEVEIPPQIQRDFVEISFKGQKLGEYLFPLVVDTSQGKLFMKIRVKVRKNQVFFTHSIIDFGVISDSQV